MNKTPNPPELVILKALWLKGSLPVRALHEICAANLNWSFSSTRKTVERMVDKGFVETCITKEKSPVIIRARISKTTMLAHIARTFFNQVLEVEGAVPISAFTNSTLLSDDELDELEGLLGSK